MPLNEEGNPKGIAFVQYKTEEGVKKALEFNETDYGGRTIYVSKAGEGGGGKGKDGKGKDGKGKGKDGKGKKGKGKGKAPSESFAKSTGAMVESTGEKKTFDDSDDE
jgi:RNA recognition motif-containing protein